MSRRLGRWPRNSRQLISLSLTLNPTRLTVLAAFTNARIRVGSSAGTQVVVSEILVRAEAVLLTRIQPGASQPWSPRRLDLTPHPA